MKTTIYKTLITFALAIIGGSLSAQTTNDLAKKINAEKRPVQTVKMEDPTPLSEDAYAQRDRKIAEKNIQKKSDTTVVQQQLIEFKKED